VYVIDKDRSSPNRAGADFERLWEETGCRAVINDLAGERGCKFVVERAVFLTVLLGPCGGSLA
jgi:hypothetical protein